VVLGVALGIGAALSVGPVFLTIIHESVTHGFGAGVRVIVGSAVADVLLLIPALAASWLIALVDAASLVVALVGAAYFVFLSLTAIRESRRLWFGGKIATGTGGWPFAKGALGNLLNPLSWAFWLATGTPTMLHVYRAADWAGLTAFTCVWFGVAMAVEGVVAASVAQTRKLVGGRHLAALQAAAALTFLVAAGVLLFRR
jgi:threonine/homoserine/homoserine lactone efflux protein